MGDLDMGRTLENADRSGQVSRRDRRLAGISTSYLSMLERGERALDRRSLIVALAKALEVAPTEITGAALAALGYRDPRSGAGVIIRVLQRILALVAAIWHNDHIGQPIKRPLTAYDH